MAWSPGQVIVNSTGAQHQLNRPIPVLARILWDRDGDPSHIPDRARPGCALTYIPRTGSASSAVPRRSPDMLRRKSRRTPGLQQSRKRRPASRPAGSRERRGSWLRRRTRLPRLDGRHFVSGPRIDCSAAVLRQAVGPYRPNVARRRSLPDHHVHPRCTGEIEARLGIAQDLVKMWRHPPSGTQARASSEGVSPGRRVNASQTPSSRAISSRRVAW
jgi:hypothetical protein